MYFIVQKTAKHMTTGTSFKKFGIDDMFSFEKNKRSTCACKNIIAIQQFCNCKLKCKKEKDLLKFV